MKGTLLTPGEELGAQAGLPAAPSLAARSLGSRGGSEAVGGHQALRWRVRVRAMTVQRRYFITFRGAASAARRAAQLHATDFA